MGCCSRNSAVQVKSSTRGVKPTIALGGGGGEGKKTSSSSGSSLPPPIGSAGAGAGGGIARDTSSVIARSSSVIETPTTASQSAVCASSDDWSSSSSISSQSKSVSNRIAEFDDERLEANLWDEDLALGKMTCADEHSTKASCSDAGAAGEESETSAAIISYRSSAELSELPSIGVSESSSNLSPLPGITPLPDTTPRLDTTPLPATTQRSDATTTTFPPPSSLLTRVTSGGINAPRWCCLDECCRRGDEVGESSASCWRFDDGWCA